MSRFFVFLSTAALILFLTACPMPPGDENPPPKEDTSSLVARVTFNPPAGTYLSAQSVTISCATSGVGIWYTTDGSIPTEASTPYTGAIAVSADMTLRAIATKDFMASALGKAGYRITGKVATPVITLGGTANAPTVTVTCATAGASIHYTLDNTAPTVLSTVYHDLFTVSISTTVRAVAMLQDWTDSDAASSTITVTLPATTAEAPAFDPPGGVYNNDQTVVLTSATSGVSIYYTTDGGDPTIFSPGYTDPITVTTKGTRIRAIAVRSGWTTSDTAEATYWLKVAMPTASPDPSAGSVKMSTPISLSSATPGTSFYYTISGQTPDATAIPYTVPLNCWMSQIKAIGVKSGYDDSDVMTMNYAEATYHAYTDGAGHIDQLVLNGPDVDISNSFDHISDSMSFGCYHDDATYYSSGDAVYQLVMNNNHDDIDASARFEHTAANRTLYCSGFDVFLYKAGSHLYRFEPGVSDDVELTVTHFTADSDYQYPVYTDGAGGAYAIQTDQDVTAAFDYLTASSHLYMVDQFAEETALGYITDNKIYVIQAAIDTQFDWSEYEHFSFTSKIFMMPELY